MFVLVLCKADIRDHVCWVLFGLHALGANYRFYLPLLDLAQYLYGLKFSSDSRASALPMTSYTLGNWDGGQSNARDIDSKQHQTSKTSFRELLPPANAQSTENTVQDAQGTHHDASRMDTTHGARDVALLAGDDGSGAVRNEVSCGI